MVFSERIDEAGRIAAAAIRRMQAESVAPTPENYTVWYAYYTGAFPELAKAIDILASNGQSFSGDRCAELYREFFTADADVEVIRDAGIRLAGTVETALTALVDGGSELGRYAQVLAQVGDGLGLVKTLEQLKALVTTVASETDRMAQVNRRLETELQEAKAHVEAMKQDMDAVRRQALTDGLTGIANRRHFDETLRAAAAQAMETGQALSLLMVDIDHFKKFNDTHGHQMGDQVLKLVARTLKEQVKGRDTPARYGGEEFAIIMPTTRVKDATVVAEQIRLAVASRRIVNRRSGEALGTITLSVGVARYRPGEALATLINRADAALYTAKRSGRNQVVADRSDLAFPDGAESAA